MDITRLHRVLRLLTILQAGTEQTATQLAERLGISRRTLFRDLKTLEAAGFPCKNRSGKGYQIDSALFLPPVNLKVGEALGLMLLGEAAVAQPDQPFALPAADAIKKLIAMMPTAIRDFCGSLMQHMTVRPPSAALANDDVATHADLQQAIDQCCQVNLRYHSLFDGDVITVILRPYHLHFESRAWYVIGYSERHREVRTFKLSRVKSIELTTRHFRRDRSFKLDQYLGNAWRLIPEKRRYRVELEFTAKVAHNVSEVRWHHSQSHRILPDGRCIMTFDVDGINEISWWVLGYGDQVVVRKPVALKRRVCEFYQAALDRYEDKAPIKKTKPDKKDRRK